MNERLQQIETDLLELEGQLSSGEIGEATGARLRAIYQNEREALLASDTPTIQAATRSPKRVAVGAAMLIAALAGSIGLVAQFTQSRDQGPRLGLANQSFDLANTTNEQMEAVLGAYKDDPAFAEQIPRMRLALAERYFVEANYSQAFEHYDVLIRTQPSPEVTSVALARVAWMVWLQEHDAALPLELIDKSLQLAPDNTDAAYAKAQLLWCGMGDTAAAVPILESVLAKVADPTAVARIEAELASARAGETC